MVLNVYRMNERMGFYHTGLAFRGSEYTFCQDAGICHHEPRDVGFATFLGAVRLGATSMSNKKFQEIIKG